ncbi:MAG TPA: hypothetical protein VGA99_11230 [bacterium]
MHITEPTTMLTDYALALLTGYFARRLMKMSAQQRSMQLWSAAFFVTASAAVVGGTSHGFALYLNDLWQAIIWKTTVYAIGVASFCMLAGTLIATIKPPLQKWLVAVTGAKFLVYAFWMINHNQFKYVIYDYAPAMLAVLALQIYAHFACRDPAAPRIIAGVLISFFAAGVQQSGFTIHQHFNHNDLYHVIQMGAIYLLFRGASLLQDD